MFAAFLYVVFSCRTRIAIAVGLLFGYWAIMRFIPVPGAPAGADPWSPEWNLAAYVDRLLLPNPLGKTGADPEGILSTLSAIVMAMLGMFAGEFVGGRFGGAAHRRRGAHDAAQGQAFRETDHRFACDGRVEP